MYACKDASAHKRYGNKTTSAEPNKLIFKSRTKATTLSHTKRTAMHSGAPKFWRTISDETSTVDIKETIADYCYRSLLQVDVQNIIIADQECYTPKV